MRDFIGEGASRCFGMWRIFARIFPKLPTYTCQRLLSPILQLDFFKFAKSCNCVFQTSDFWETSGQFLSFI